MYCIKKGKMKKIFSLFVWSISISFGFVFGQQTPILQQNYFNNYSLQPAYAGFYKGIDAWSGYRRSMLGYTGSPTSAFLNLSYRTSEFQSFGVNLQSDQSGLLKNNLFNASYAYRVKFNESRYLSVGASVGLAENRFDFTGVKLDNYNDFGVLANNGKTIVNISFGLAYLAKNWEVGAGFLNFTSNTVSYKDDKTVLSYKLRPSYILNTAYKYVFTKDIFVKPGVILRGQDKQKPIIDFFAVVGYKKIVEFTVGYRSIKVLPIVAVLNLVKGVHAYYGYEISLGDFNQATKGGYEFGIGYRVSLNKSIDNYVSNEKELVAKNDSLKKVVLRMGDTLKVKQETIKGADKLNKSLIVQNTQLTEQNAGYVKEIDSLVQIIRSNNKLIVAPYIDSNQVEIESASGYYVVLESSKDRIELQKDLIKWHKKFDNVIILKGLKHNWYYVSMYRGETKKEALKVMKKVRKKYPKAWVKIQKIQVIDESVN